MPASPAQPTDVGRGQIEVIEFFWYGCPHCFAFEPYVEAWLRHKPANVVFKRIPGGAFTGGEHWDVDARAFYTAAALGIGDRIREPLFDAIHVQNQYALITSRHALQKFFVRFGVSRSRFDSTWNSFGVQLKMNQALQIEQRYGLDGVPTFVIDGKWMTGTGYGQMEPAVAVQCIQYLVAREEARLGR